MMSKDNILVFLSLATIFLGVYTLQAEIPDMELYQHAKWGGIAAITFGTFSLLTLLHGKTTSGSSNLLTHLKNMNFYALVSIAALGAAAYFNIKLFLGLEASTLKWLVAANVVAHVALVLVSIFDMDAPKYVSPIGAAGKAFGTPRFPARA